MHHDNHSCRTKAFKYFTAKACVIYFGTISTTGITFLVREINLYIFQRQANGNVCTSAFFDNCITNGKTITGTLQEFYLRLESLLRRNNFDAGFIKREIELIKEGYIISKTNSKSILASMNVITENIEYRCTTYPNYESINVDDIEDAFMNWLVYDASKPYKLRRTSDYWKEKGVINNEHDQT